MAAEDRVRVVGQILPDLQVPDESLLVVEKSRSMLGFYGR